MSEEKSFVTEASALCPVCCKECNTGDILLNTQLSNTFERVTCVGWGDMCPEHQKLRDEGYVALVEVDLSKSGRPVTYNSAYRTGRLAHVRRSAWDNMFTTPPPDGGVCMIESGTMDAIKKAHDEVS